VKVPQAVASEVELAQALQHLLRLQQWLQPLRSEVQAADEVPEVWIFSWLESYSLPPSRRAPDTSLRVDVISRGHAHTSQVAQV